MYHHNQTTGSNFPMFFSMPNNPYDDNYGYGHHDMYSSSSSSSSSSSVDCTLSLGTPSTRLIEHEEKRNPHERRWDLLQSKHNTQSQSKTIRGSNGNSNNDSLLARRCANCDTTSTPLWRNGPRGPKSLCNACGIRYKKEERRASAAAAATSAGVMESPNMYSHHNNSWYSNTQNQKMSNELRFMDDANRDSENGIPNFLPWRLNVAADRTSLVHDFTI